jgi:hypothetical protein
MKATVLAFASVLALSLAIASVPMEVSFATSAVPGPTAIPTAPPAITYKVARNPFVLDSTVRPAPASGDGMAAADAQLIGVVLGDHPEAIFADRNGNAVTLAIGDHVGSATIREITMTGVTLSNGAHMDISQGQASYGYADQSQQTQGTLIVPPVAPGASTSVIPVTLPSPRLPLDSTTGVDGGYQMPSPTPVPLFPEPVRTP